MLKFWIPGAAPPGAPSIDASFPTADVVEALEPDDHNWLTWNPYPVLCAPTKPSWPRGLPLDDVMREECNNVKLKSTKVANKSIAVLQSLSDRQPDSDALHQAIMPLPFYFEKKEMTPVMVPPYTLTPYNKQATLHFEVGFWALYLPNTIDGELSDIWRSYIGQRLFWEADLRVGFIGRPLVVQDRNIHITVDKTAIKDGSDKIRQFITFLGSWRGQGNTLFERIEQLWLALFENKFVGHEDVKLVQLWLQNLMKTGYKFPELSNTAIPNPVYNSDQSFTTSVDKLFPKDGKMERYTVRENTPEYDNDVYQMDSTSDSLTFWNSDIHFATCLDQPSMLGELGHRVLIAIGQRDDYHNPFVFKLKGIHLYDRVSGVLRKCFS